MILKSNHLFHPNPAFPQVSQKETILDQMALFSEIWEVQNETNLYKLIS